MNKFPAIAIGGPPNSGKSVLTYSLTRALRAYDIEHYVLRACPDGEGDWSSQEHYPLVRVLRNSHKGAFTPEFVESVCNMLFNRHLPLLVDVGGRPTAEQEKIFEACTHMILLVRDDAEDALTAWKARATRHNLPLIAELHSTVIAPDTIYKESPTLVGCLSGLERHQLASGPVFERLSLQLRTLLTEFSESRRAHLDAAPAEMAVDIDRMARALLLDPTRPWQPSDLPDVLAYLPTTTPLALYGRGPNWLYAAAALHAHPQPFFQFDPRLEWVQPLPHVFGDDLNAGPIIWRTLPIPNGQLIDGRIDNMLLDYATLTHLTVPKVAAQDGVIISGRLPLWVVTMLARAYSEQPFVAIYQPQSQGGVVVASRSRSHRVGTLQRFEQSWLKFVVEPYNQLP